MAISSKLIGLTALCMAACYVFGFVILATVMNPGNVEGWTQAQRLEFVLDRERWFQVWNIVIYVVFGVALVVLTALLHKPLAVSADTLMSIASPFGFIWAGLVIASGMTASVGLTTVADLYQSNAEDALQLWKTVGTIQNGLGGGIELVGGIWILLLSLAALRTNEVLPRLTNWLGILVGVFGILTIIPTLSMLGAAFGITQILWFLAVAGVMFRKDGEVQLQRR